VKATVRAQHSTSTVLHVPVAAPGCCCKKNRAVSHRFIMLLYFSTWMLLVFASAAWALLPGSTRPTGTFVGTRCAVGRTLLQRHLGLSSWSTPRSLLSHDASVTDVDPNQENIPFVETDDDGGLHPREQFIHHSAEYLQPQQQSPAPIQGSEQDPRHKLTADFLAIVIPSLIACLAEPLLTLVDSYYVGRSAAHVIGLAALSVNGAIFNVLAAASYPLCTATTNIIAKLQGYAARNESMSASSIQSSPSESTLQSSKWSVLMHGTGLALILGLIASGSILTHSTYLLQNIFNVKINGEVFGPASQYLHIRAATMPSAFLNYVIIGYSLGVQEAVAPILSLASAAVVNLVGDYILVSKLGWGLRGAAWATACASYVGSVLAMARLVSVFRPPTQADPNHQKNSPRAIRRIPVDFQLLRSYFSTSGLMVLGSLLNTVTYSSGARVVGAVKSSGAVAATSTIGGIVQSSLPTLHIATQQIAMQMWWFLSFFSSPISLAAQSLLPRDLPSNSRSKIQPLLKLLASTGLGAAVLCAFANFIFLRYFSGIFTSDVVVSRLLKSVTGAAVVSQFIVVLTTVLDGVYIGSDHVKQYVSACIISTSIATISSAVSMYRGVGVSGYWASLVLFTASRLAYYLTQLPKTRVWPYLTNYAASSDGDQLKDDTQSTYTPAL
jgi:Na+-driven multidrug efflux pump